MTKSKMQEHDLLVKAEKEPVKLVYEIIEETKAAMSSATAAWRRYRTKYRRGLKYLSEESGAGRKPLYFTNLLFSTVESVRANLTKALPSVVLRPMEEGDDVAADIMSKILTHSMLSGGLREAIQRVVFHSCIVGRGWFKVWFDSEAFYGMGENKVESIAPEHMLIDPLALDYRQARWFVHVHEDVPIEFIKANYGKYPEVADDSSSAGFKDKDTRPAVGKVANVYECWLRVWETSEEDSFAQKWRIITVSGSTKLRDQESEYLHGMSPFVPFSSVEDDGADNAYTVGVGEIEEIEPLQDKMDWMDRAIQKNIALIINRQRFINPASGLNPNQMDNTEGRVYLVNGNPRDAVLWDSPPALGHEIFGYRGVVENQIQTVSGVFDVTQGRKPAGLVAARAIASLQDAAAVRFEHKKNALSESIRAVANLCLENILQFYTEERVVRLQGGSQYRILGTYPEELHITDEMAPEEIQMIEQVRLQFKEENGISLVLEDIDFNFDVMVDTDSPLPASKSERGQMAVDLFRLGAIDRKSLLDTLDWQDRDATLSRLDAETTGKTANQEMPGGQMEQIMQGMMQALAQMGMDEQTIQAVLQQAMGGGQGQPQQPENHGIMR